MAVREHRWDEVADGGTDPAADGVKQVVTPTEGAVVQMTDSGVNGYLRLIGDGAFTTVGLRVPTAANGRDTMVRRVFFDCTIDMIDWGPDQVIDGPTSAAPGDSCTLIRLEPDLWQRAR